MLYLLVSAASLSLIMTVVLEQFALRYGVVDRPGPRKLHLQPTPAVGGIGVLLAVAVVLLIFVDFANLPVGLIIGLFLVTCVGVLDDAFEISAPSRLALQTLAVAPAVMIDGAVIENFGDLFSNGAVHADWLAVPATIFFLLAVANAFNMIDGIDGLAGSIALVTICFLLFLRGVATDDGTTIILLIAAGGVVGFLALNLRHKWRDAARVFLGDGGSLMLGFLVAYAIVDTSKLASSPEVDGTYGMVKLGWIVYLPALDLVRLIANRVMSGRHPFDADRRHIHHMLLRRGLSVTAALIWLVGATILTGLFAVAGTMIPFPDWLMFVSFFIVGATYWISTALVESAARSEDCRGSG